MNDHDLATRVMRVLEAHDRCPPEARDYSRRRGTAILIMQEFRQSIADERQRCARLVDLFDDMPRSEIAVMIREGGE